MAKVVYIIPGFGGSFDRRCKADREIMNVFHKKMKVIPVKINWHRKTMSDYVEEFFGQLKHKKNDEVYFFGFSFGAFISLVVSQNVKPKMQVLCSLSPYFAEDLRRIPKRRHNFMGKKRMEDFENFSFDSISKKVVGKTVLFVGEMESKFILNRNREAVKKLRNGELFIVEGGKHKLDGKYLEEVLGFISSV